MCPAQVKLWTYRQENLETIWPFLKCIVARSFDNTNFSERNFNLHANKVIPINPLGPIVHGLHLSIDTFFSFLIRCMPEVSVFCVWSIVGGARGEPH